MIEIEVLSTNEGADELLEELDAWFRDAFQRSSLTWAPPHHFALAFAEGRLIARAGLIERTVRVGTTPVRVGGISGVAVRPTWRGQGIARRLLARSASFVREDLGAAFGLLLCRDEVRGLYETMGWRPTTQPTRFAQPGSVIEYPHRTMILQCSSEPWPAGVLDLCGLPW